MAITLSEYDHEWERPDETRRDFIGHIPILLPCEARRG
jgi:hypothetical protein